MIESVLLAVPAALWPAALLAQALLRRWPRARRAVADAGEPTIASGALLALVLMLAGVVDPAQAARRRPSLAPAMRSSAPGSPSPARRSAPASRWPTPARRRSPRSPRSRRCSAGRW